MVWMVYEGREQRIGEGGGWDVGDSFYIVRV